MNENTFLCIVCSVAIAGCSTCHVTSSWREVEIERIKAEERLEIITEKP